MIWCIHDHMYRLLHVTLYVVLYMYLAAVTNVISYVTFRRNVTLTIPFYIPLYIIWRTQNIFSGRTLYDVQKGTWEFNREWPLWGLLRRPNTGTVHHTGFQIWTVPCPWQPVRGQTTGRPLGRDGGRSPSWGEF